MGAVDDFIALADLGGLFVLVFILLVILAVVLRMYIQEKKLREDDRKAYEEKGEECAEKIKDLNKMMFTQQQNRIEELKSADIEQSKLLAELTATVKILREAMPHV